MLIFLSCTINGNTLEIPPQLTSIVSTVVNIIKIGVPVILIVLGMIDMGKAVASQKEEDIKKGQKVLLSRCIAAGIVFFVVAIVQLLVSVITNADGSTGSVWDCVCDFVGCSSNSVSETNSTTKKSSLNNEGSKSSELHQKED